jgi:hypothetical protein
MLGAVAAPLTSLRPARPTRRYDPGGLVIRDGSMAPAHTPAALGGLVGTGSSGAGLVEAAHDAAKEEP